MKKVEINNFLLYTTGLICIDFEYDGEELFLNVDIDLAMMLKMMQKEGLKTNDIQRLSDNSQPIKFEKVTLIIFEEDGKKGSFYTSEVFDDPDDPNVFHVEIKD